MPSQTLDALFRSLGKGEVAPVYYLYGPEDILKDEAVRAILDRALDPGLRDFNFDQRSAAQLDPEAVITLCTTLPMMAEHRVVLIRDVEAWRRKTRARSAFVRYLERPSPETVVILVQGAGEEDQDQELARGAVAVRCDPLPPDRALKWLRRRAAALGISLEGEAEEHLLRSVGNDLGPLAAELQKLAALPAGEPLTAERVGELVGVRHGETLYDWRDALFDGRADRALDLVRPVLAQPGVSAVKLITLVGSTLAGLGIARGMLDRGVRGRALEDAVFKLLLRLRVFGLLSYREESARWARWAPRWPGNRLAEALRAARDADLAIKSTTISSEQEIVTDMVLRMVIGLQDAA
jgi:DNA polymerase-3 subunit delta